MKKLVFAIIIFSIIAFKLQAQTTQTQKSEKINPAFTLADIYFLEQTLETIELNGPEVDAFIEIRDILNSTLKTSQDKKVTDIVQVEMNLNTAQNLLSFLNRAKISGARADQFKRIWDTILNEIKKAKN